MRPWAALLWSTWSPRTRCTRSWTPPAPTPAGTSPLRRPPHHGVHTLPWHAADLRSTGSLTSAVAPIAPSVTYDDPHRAGEQPLLSGRHPTAATGATAARIFSATAGSGRHPSPSAAARPARHSAAGATPARSGRIYRHLHLDDHLPHRQDHDATTPSVPPLTALLAISALILGVVLVGLTRPPRPSPAAAPRRRPVTAACGRPRPAPNSILTGPLAHTSTTRSWSRTRQAGRSARLPPRAAPTP